MNHKKSTHLLPVMLLSAERILPLSTRASASNQRRWRSAQRLVLAFLLAVGWLAAIPAQAQWLQTPFVTAGAASQGYYGGEGCQRFRGFDIGGDGNVLVFGTDVGGVWRSTNGGAMWEPSRRGLKPRGAWAVAIDPNNSSRVLIVGGHSYGASRGLWMSTNTAVDWFPVNQANCGGGPKWQIAWDPSSFDGTKSTRAYWSQASTITNVDYGLTAPHQGNGNLYRSTDGGLTWTAVQTGVTYGNAYLAVHPTSGRLYVGTPVTGGGVYYSDNQGVSFTKTLNAEIRGLAVSKSAPNFVVVNCLVSSVNRIYVSTDSGATWDLKAATGLPGNQSNIRVSPVTTNYMSIGASATGWVDAHYSHDGGNSWTKATYPAEPNLINGYGVHGLPNVGAWHPTLSNVVINTRGDFVVKSTDGGVSYVWHDNGYTSFAARYTIFNLQDPNLAIVTGQDYSGAYTTNGGATWFWKLGSGHTMGGYVFSPTRLVQDRGPAWAGPFTLYLSTNSGVTWSAAGPTGGGVTGAYGNPVNANGAFWNNYRTTDAGQTWQAMTASSVQGVVTHNADPSGAKELYGIWNGSNDRRVMKSTDQGTNWTLVVKMPGDSVIQEVAYDYINSRLYIAYGDQGYGKLYQYQGGVLTDISNRLPLDPLVSFRSAQCVAVDPVDPRVVYVGRQDDVYGVGYSVMRSTNSGTNWTGLSLQPGQPGLDGGGRGALRMQVHPVTRQLWVSASETGTWRYTAPNGLPIVAVTASDPTAAEPSSTGAFTVSRAGNTSSNLMVFYTISGIASNGVDYVNLPGSVTLLAGAFSTNLTVTPIDDLLVEGDETVVLTLATNAAYTVGAPSSATVTIADDDGPSTITITATDLNAAEPSDPSTFRITRSGSISSNLTVFYSISGTASKGVDYASLPGSVTIPAGSVNAMVTVNPIDDSLVEGNETTVLTLAANAAYVTGSPGSATVTIADNDGPPTIAITDSDMNVVEAGGIGVFTISRPSVSSSNLTVFYTLSGTAGNGLDYASLPGSATILAGSLDATVIVNPIDDNLVEGNETVTLTLTPNAAYTVGFPDAATMTIVDDDGVVVTEVTEPFDTAEDVVAHGWTGVGNTSNGNNFSFSNTDNTGFGSPAGEAGGVIARTTSISFYGDATLGTTFTLTNALHGYGELAITAASTSPLYDNAVVFGFCNTTNAGVTLRKNTLGLTLAEPIGGGQGTYRVRPTFTLGDGTTVQPVAVINLTPGNSTYKYTVDYDPSAGVNSQGRLTVQMFNSAGASLGTLDQDLTAAQRSIGASFNAYGLITGGLGSANSGNTITLYIDQLTYSSAIGNYSAQPLLLSSPQWLGNGQFQFAISGSVGQSYIVQAATNLLNWLPLQTNLLTNGVTTFTDTQAINFNSRTYRLQRTP
ncbi:MAG: Calx-beta domain-containing protein [Verrucomicrobiota bacterium]